MVGTLCLKYQFPCFLPLFWWKSHEKGNCIVIETNDKNKSTKWYIRKFQGRCFRCVLSQMAFQDVGLKVSLHDLCVSARITVFLFKIAYSLNHDRLKWSFKLFLVINLLSKATFLLHILWIRNDYTEFIFVLVKIDNISIGIQSGQKHLTLHGCSLGHVSQL